MGDMEFSSSYRTNSEFNKGKTYGFKTDGTIVNRGDQVFGNLVASANQSSISEPVDECWIDKRWYYLFLLFCYKKPYFKKLNFKTQ